MVTKDNVREVIELINTIGNSEDSIYKRFLLRLEKNPNDKEAIKNLVVKLVEDKLAVHAASLAENMLGMYPQVAFFSNDRLNWHLDRKPIIKQICDLLDVSFPRIVFRPEIIWLGSEVESKKLKLKEYSGPKVARKLRQ